MVNAGLSDVIGSWKIIAMRSPRIARIRFGVARRRSAPSNRISPPATRPGGATRPMIESAVTLLPQPDSPTMPSVRPASSAKLTPSTALNVPASVVNAVREPADFEQCGHRGQRAVAAWKRAISASIAARSVMPAGRAREARQETNGWKRSRLTA